MKNIGKLKKLAMVLTMVTSAVKSDFLDELKTSLDQIQDSVEKNNEKVDQLQNEITILRKGFNNIHCNKIIDLFKVKLDLLTLLLTSGVNSDPN